MNMKLRLFISALSCLSCASSAGVQYVKAKKAKMTDRRKIEVVILAPDGKTIISDDTFTQKSNTTKGKSNLFFNFNDHTTNNIRVYQNNKRVLKDKKDIEVSQNDLPFNPEIIIHDDKTHANNTIEFREKQ